MKTPQWIPLQDTEASVVELVPLSNGKSVLIAKRQGSEGIEITSLRLQCGDGNRAVHMSEVQTVCETLGILEALGQKAPPPAGDVEDARRYRVLNSLLNRSKTVVLRIRDDVFNVESAASMMSGDTLSRAIDDSEIL